MISNVKVCKILWSLESFGSIYCTGSHALAMPQNTGFGYTGSLLLPAFLQNIFTWMWCPTTLNIYPLCHHNYNSTFLLYLISHPFTLVIHRNFKQSKMCFFRERQPENVACSRSALGKISAVRPSQPQRYQSPLQFFEWSTVLKFARGSDEEVHLHSK